METTEWEKIFKAELIKKKAKISDYIKQYNFCMSEKIVLIKL